MKRQWGFDHIMTKKTKKRASADVGFIFIAYNLKRIINCIGLSKLIDLLPLFLSLYYLKRVANCLKKEYQILKLPKYELLKITPDSIFYRNYSYF